MFKQFYEDCIEPQRETSWFFFIGNYVLYAFFVVFLMFIVYPNHWISTIDFATEGIINTTFIASFGVFLIIVIIIVRFLGQVKLNSIGLNLHELPVGLISFFGLYIILNILLLIINVAVNNPLIWYPYWMDSGTPGITWDVGNLLGQIFGNVLLEEVFYRGFLFIQFSKKFIKSMNSVTWGIILGAIASNFLFSLLHIPSLIRQGVYGTDMVLNLLFLFAIGVLLTFVYFITENIFIAMSVHILNNISFALFNDIYPTTFLILFITIAAMIIWAVIKIQMQKKNTEYPLQES
jgi:membrane protease YdiL (CAAX protease family)